MFPFRSKLLGKAFLSVVLGLSIWLPVFYWLTVPLVNQLAYEVEEKAARNVLGDVTRIVGQSHQDLEAWRQSALDGHRRELKNIVLMAESWARQLDADVAAGKLPREAARRDFLEKLRALRYGNNDYVWAADYQSVFQSHPDAAFHKRDASAVRDARGNLLLPAMVALARNSGEGYFSYLWRRLDSGQDIEKLSYVRNFPQWQLVIGSGVYIDDIDREFARRQEAMLAGLREHLRTVKVAGSGYVFVVDGKKRAVIHPDPRLEGSDVSGEINADSGRPLVDDLMEAARRPDKTLNYRWSSGDDPAHHDYAKVAWVHHFPESDWYLGASAYIEDLGRSGQHLSERILIAFVLGFIATAIIAFVFIRSLTSPILRLAEVARRNVAGDLSAVSDIKRSDEIGVLAEAFNSMVVRLRNTIADLENRVARRTRQLADWAEHLETEVATRTAEARAAEAKFRGLVEQSLVGIFVLQDGSFRYVNPRFAQMHGYESPADILRLAEPEALIVPAERERIEAYRRAFDDGARSHFEIAYAGQRPDGTPIHVEVSARRVEYEGAPAIIGVAIDVTARKKIQDALEGQQARLEETVATRTAQLQAANQQLQAFTYAASHDLKSPLRGIRSFAGMLDKQYGDRLEGDGALFLGHIRRSAERMTELIDDLLAHARMEQGKADIRPVDLEALVQSVLAERYEEIRQRRAEIRLDLVSTSILAETQNLRQALRNLIENALKYSGRSTRPIIEIGSRQEGGLCRLWVKDNGVGFDMAYHDRIFEIFQRLHTYDEFPGSGVGLALVRKAMERMGGRVWAESTPGQGATFYLEFHLAETQRLLPPPPQSRDEGESRLTTGTT